MLSTAAAQTALTVHEERSIQIESYRKDFPLDEVFTYKPDLKTDGVSEEAQDSIIKLVVAEQTRSKGPWNPLDIDRFLLDIEWVWKTERGTLPKRVAQWYYKETKSKLPDEVVSQIGNLAANDKPIAPIYYFDITKDLTWKKGDYGDYGSCFFNKRGPGYEPKKMMDDGRMEAIRFYKPIPKVNGFTIERSMFEDEENLYYGISRAWMLHDKVTTSAQVEDLRVVFNGYGLSTLQIATVVSSFLDLPLKKVSIYDSRVHINNSCGYLIGKEEVINPITNYSFTKHKPDSVLSETHRFEYDDDGDDDMEDD